MNPFSPTLRSSQSAPLTFAQMDNNLSGIADVANAALVGAQGISYNGGTVTVVGSAAPSAGWILQATGPNTAAWQPAGAGLGTVTSVQGTNANGVSWAITSPTSTPNLSITLGAITPISVNGVTFSGAGAIVSGAGSTFTVAGAFALTLTTTAATAATFPAGTFDVGYLNVPPNQQIVNYTTVYGDAGKCIEHPSTDNNARTFTINNGIAYEVGTCISFTNLSATALSIAITSGILYLAGSGFTGTRTLAQFGIATARLDSQGFWIISGTGLT